ncbi:hypothetical protein V494_00539 [Pseudogymnoascus sp. VKM F-4513 (FW-928)]|nr:hypothetical protein V494_00539 [Pseudogymnoascus sp. VKM F-4513 (FW-928)]
MVSRKQEPDGGVPTGGGGNGAGAPQPQYTQGGGEGAGGEGREQGGGLGGQGIPESLRPGPPGGVESTNPFVRAQQTGNVPASGPEPVVNPWAGEEEKGGPAASVPDTNAPDSSAAGSSAPDANAPGSKAPDASAPPVPSKHQDSNVTDQFQNLNIEDQSTNPWEGSIEQNPAVKQHPPPSLGKEDSGNEAWSSPTPPTRAAPERPPPPLINVEDTNESSNWDDGRQDLLRNPGGEPVVAQDAENVWGETSGQPSRPEAEPASSAAPQKESMPEDAGREPTGAGEQQSGLIDTEGHETSSQRPIPPLPPSLPPRNVGDTEGARTSHEETRAANTDAPAPAPRRDAVSTEEQKKETYTIKNITWHDETTRLNPRVTPILTQNANGPCPLLALVNALTISTPADMSTPLIETLRTRENISLELLLNGVFEELMSGRLDDGSQVLPDISDLYTFLITLHTGMTVNPSFFPPASTNLANDIRRFMSHVHPSERENRVPGTFEQTREIMLYGTFGVPLVHGWLPEHGSTTQEALARSARTYEGAQHLMFREDELEAKFIGDGLSFEEQATLDDIMTVRSFLFASQTQLTNFGLETIRTALKPGSVAILFRNDHFSTLYKHPRTEQLMNLVTDAGLARHEEIVWESLPDVNGENCAFYSGDFRPVGGDTQSRQAGSDDRDSRQRVPEGSTSASGNASSGHRRGESSSEQEDHDLALAIQLQEEENERHEEEVRRRRESGPNQQQQGPSRPSNAGSNVSVSRGGGFSGAPRRGNGHSSSQSLSQSQRQSQSQSQSQPQSRPHIQSSPPQRTNPEPPAEEQLPTYGEAAAQPSFVPPEGHPAHAGTVAPGAGRRVQQQAGRQPQGFRRRQAQSPAQPVGGSSNQRPNQAVQGRDRECAVM